MASSNSGNVPRGQPISGSNVPVANPVQYQGSAGSISNLLPVPQNPAQLQLQQPRLNSSPPYTNTLEPNKLSAQPGYSGQIGSSQDQIPRNFQNPSYRNSGSQSSLPNYSSGQGEPSSTLNAPTAFAQQGQAQAPRNSNPQNAPIRSTSTTTLGNQPEISGYLQHIHKDHKTYTYWNLYRFVTWPEWLLLVLGTIFALGSGVFIPLMVLEFGTITDKMVLLALNPMPRLRPGTTGVYHGPFCLDLNRVMRFGSGGTILVTNNKGDYISAAFHEFCWKHGVYAVALLFTSFVYFICWFYVGEQQINRISTAHFTSLLRKDQKWLDMRKEQDFPTSIMENTQRIREGIGEHFGITLALFSIFTFSMINAFYHGWKLTLVSAVSIPVMIIISTIVASVEAKQVVEQQVAYSHAGGLADEVLLNIRTVMVYGGQKKEFHEYCRRVEEKQGKVYCRLVLFSLASAFMWLLTYSNYALSFWYGTKLVLDDRDKLKCDGSEYSPGDLVIIFFSVMFGAMNIGIVFPMIESMLVANNCAKEVLHVVDSSSEVDGMSDDGLIPPTPAAGHFEFSDVWFTYPTRADPVLRGVNMSVKPGMVVALVGASGCGKSTILKLISKEYLQNSGFIKLDGIDIRAYNTAWLRSQIAVVTQDGGLFDDTIEENVRMGKPDAGFVEITQACAAANAHTFISQLQKGYQTQVGYQGNKLSGGQRQRIAIARALIREPRILLLDEPTSALDNQSENIVQAALVNASKNRTTFIVAHRLNTITSADMIFVFSNGMIAERGKHEDLIKKKGLYYALASGAHNKPSKQMETEVQSHGEASSRHQLEALRAFDATVKYPFKQVISYPVAEKLVQEQQKHRRDSLLLANTERETDDDVFKINARFQSKSPGLMDGRIIEGPVPGATLGNGNQFPYQSKNTNKQKQNQSNQPAQYPYMSTVTKPGQKQGQYQGYNPAATQMPPYPEYSQPGQGLQYQNAPGQQRGYNIFEMEQMHWQKFLEAEDSTSFMTDIPPTKKFGFCSILRMASYSCCLVIVGILASLLMGTVLPTYAYLFGEVIGELAEPNLGVARRNCVYLTIGFIVIGGAAGIAIFFQSLTLNIAGLKAVLQIRKRLFLSMMRQDVGWYDNPENAVAILSDRLTYDAGNIQYVTQGMYGVLVQSFTTIIISYAIAFYFAPRLTGYCAGLVPVVILMAMMDGWLAKVQDTRASLAMDAISKLIMDVFHNKYAVATCQIERVCIEKFSKFLSSTKKGGADITFGRSIAFGLGQSAAFLTYTICMLISGIEMRNGVAYEDVLKVGDCLIFGLLTVGTSLAIIPSFTKAIQSGERILRILRRQPKLDFDGDGYIMNTCTGNLAFRNVQFWYPHASDSLILNDISFSVKPGEMVALVGSSGSGKSTCIQMALRFHDVCGGGVEIDGNDIRAFNCASVRAHMALVEQTPRLFDRTVAENIAYGDNSQLLNIGEIVRAAKAANIHTFITSLPEGYDTQVGKSGGNLSGGQKQRISIARALLKDDRQILFLDEATSALDQESEKVVMESLEAARKGRACIAIAHRLVSIKQADLIIVMHQGHVVQFGRHDQLIAKKGLYSMLWKSQNPLLSDEFTGNTSVGGIFSKATNFMQASSVDPYAPVKGPAPPAPAPAALNSQGTAPVPTTQPPASDLTCTMCNVFA